MHARHRELGGNIKWAGDWRRPYDYGDPEGEALSVNQAAGLIDVSTLGKLLVRGPDAGAFLDKLYPNRFSNLKPGRIRYGVISSDAGRIVDDGTICRLDDDSFYVTTTSSGAGAVEEWFSWWLADWGMQVHLTDLTQGLSAVNLAGPKAREIMAAVTELDCSNEGFQYMDGKRALIAGVPCLIMRIGFVGEVGYEIHFPAAHGEHVWDALLKAGKSYGLRPFGLEPQRILPPAEAAHHRRAGHRLRVDALQRGDGVDRQARQGGRLHRPAGRWSTTSRSNPQRGWSGSRCRAGRSRPRALSSSTSRAPLPDR